MALQLIKTVAPCMEYGPPGEPGNYFLYNPYLVTPPRNYIESIKAVKQFFYAPQEDVYVGYFTMDYLYWPSWKMIRRAWNAADGSMNEQYSTDEAGIFFSHWTNQIGVGGYGKFYSTGNSYLEVKEVDWQAGTWLPWQCYDWAGRNPAAFYFAVVNRVDKLVAGISSSRVLYIFNYETHELVGQVAILDSGQSMAYESDKHLWVTHASGKLAKINYQTRRHEMLSKVKDPVAGEDLTYRCAFDTKRGRLTILRHKKDATDGACRLQLEFYNPVPQAQIITAPVPVNPLNTGSKTTFVAHVLGDAGEGIASQAATAELVAPATGSLDSNLLLSGLNGALNIRYTAKADTAETLKVSTEI